MKKADWLPTVKALIKDARFIVCTPDANFVCKKLMSDIRVNGIKRPKSKLTNVVVKKNFKYEELFLTILK